LARARLISASRTFSSTAEAIRSVIASCRAKMSLRSPSKRSAQMWAPADADGATNGAKRVET
jgi:hypothetical protein